MDYKVEQGNYVPDPKGMPMTVSGKELLLNNAQLRLHLKRGLFPYNRELGSGLWCRDALEEHSLERAVSLANESLLDMAGVRAVSASVEGDELCFTVITPLGEGVIRYGKL